MRPTRASITQGPILPSLLSFFFPILFGACFQQLYGTADAIVVGRFVGSGALAAVGGGTTTYINLILGFFIGLTSGAGVVVSQLVGAREKETVHEAIETGIALALVTGAIITILGLWSARGAMRLIGMPSDIFDISVTYLHIYFIGSIPTMLYNMGSSILRSMGDSRHPLYILVVACVANMVLDVLFVAVFKWGIKGAAWATVACMSLSAMLVFRYLGKNYEPAFRFAWKDLRLDRKLSGQMLRIGLPTGVRGSMYGISNIIIQAALNTLGTTILAGYTAYSKMDAVFWMICNSFGVAMTVFAGQNYGARQYARIRKANWISFGICSAITVVLSVFTLAFNRQISSLFTSDPAVIDVASQIYWIITPIYLSYITLEIMPGTMGGCGQTFIPTLFSIIGICVVRILWVVCYFPTNPSIFSLMVVYPVSWVVTSVAFWVYYASGKWLARK